jgi:hypothetical protein
MATLIHKTFAMTITAFVFGALIFTPVTTLSARADDDDWEDRWEDYYEELEERREEARERWEDREEEMEELREKGFLVPYGGWHSPHYGNRVYHQPQAGVRYYEYHDGPTHNPYYLPPPNRYEVYRPAYRYYGTPQIGYYDFGRGGSVRVGPIQVFWD